MTKKLNINNLNVYEKGSGKKAAIFLHGYGANGRDLQSFGSFVAPERHLFFPEGPHVLEQFFIDAHAWFHIDLSTLVFDHEEYMESVGLLVDLINQLNIAPEESVIAGFSQGAMMALETALALDKPFKAVGLLSTTLIDAPRVERMSSKKALRFFQSHGLHDSLLPYKQAKELFALLQKASWQGEFVSFPGEHEIPEDVAFKLKEFIDALDH